MGADRLGEGPETFYGCPLRSSIGLDVSVVQITGIAGCDGFEVENSFSEGKRAAAEQGAEDGLARISRGREDQRGPQHH
jgi:hypothetical protein